MAKAPITLVTKSTTRVAFGIALAILFIQWGPLKAIAQTCPNAPLPATVSPTPPSDVCIPTGFGGNPIDFFDDFSWRSFIAMVWPVKPGMRGVPDASQNFGPVTGPLVFETFKADWEVFQPSPDGTSEPAAPSSWQSFAGQSACRPIDVFTEVISDVISLVPFSSQPSISYPIFDGPKSIVQRSVPRDFAFGDLVLTSLSKFGNLGEAGFGNLVGFLPAQNRTYTRYATYFNQAEFNKILNDRLDLRKNFPVGLTFPNNSIDIKAAWMDMSGVPNPGRYYTRMAWVLNEFASPPTCTKITVGLVGLHIVQKTASRPEWIWSTFEQIDNVPGGVSVGRFNYNDGTGTAMPATNPDPFQSTPSATPTIFNVERKTPINPSTVATNQRYRTALQANGGPWQFYQLVMTQWPIKPQPTSASGPAQPPNTFPGTAPTSAFANVTMETFDQQSISTGCMSCHDVAGTDLVWSLAVNAWPSRLSPPSARMHRRIARPFAATRGPASAALPPELEKLKELMQSGTAH